MSRNIPRVRRWLVNYWREGKVIASRKVDAPTKFLAILNLRYDYHPDYSMEMGAADRRTITPLKSTRNAGKIVPAETVSASKLSSNEGR